MGASRLAAPAGQPDRARLKKRAMMSYTRRDSGSPGKMWKACQSPSKMYSRASTPAASRRRCRSVALLAAKSRPPAMSRVGGDRRRRSGWSAGDTNGSSQAAPANRVIRPDAPALQRAHPRRSGRSRARPNPPKLARAAAEHDQGPGAGSPWPSIQATDWAVRMAPAEQP